MKVAVMGYGTVGSGVVEVIEAHSNTIPKKIGGESHFDRNGNNYYQHKQEYAH